MRKPFVGIALIVFVAIAGLVLVAGDGDDGVADRLDASAGPSQRPPEASGTESEDPASAPVESVPEVLPPSEPDPCAALQDALVAFEREAAESLVGLDDEARSLAADGSASAVGVSFVAPRSGALLLSQAPLLDERPSVLGLVVSIFPYVGNTTYYGHYVATEPQTMRQALESALAVVRTDLEGQLETNPELVESDQDRIRISTAVFSLTVETLQIQAIVTQPDAAVEANLTAGDAFAGVITSPEPPELTFPPLPPDAASRSAADSACQEGS